MRFGLRDYDPSVGRWTCKDPVGLVAGGNPYAYCSDDPINYADPSGLIGEEILLAYLYATLRDTTVVEVEQKVNAVTKIDTKTGRPVIFLKKGLCPEDRRSVLAHEYVHALQQLLWYRFGHDFKITVSQKVYLEAMAYTMQAAYGTVDPPVSESLLKQNSRTFKGLKSGLIGGATLQNDPGLLFELGVGGDKPVVGLPTTNGW